jgi:S-sulfo-L-cysteine synthase (O-acetyl-L-serine-dependent)
VNVLDLIGGTPLVELPGFAPRPGVRLFAKLEGQNPGGSVKDRPALAMVRGALERGQVRAGDRLVEATSGNTGIALAFIARQLGLTMTLVMPDDATAERVRTMRAYGAELILTPAERTIEHAREVADRLVAEEGYVLLDQFANADNWRAHERTTGPEIWAATEGRITHFVSAMGTTGTIMGVSRALKARAPNVTIVGTQPSAGSSIPGIRRWSPAFVPAIFEPDRVDRIVDVSADAARAHARRLARDAGLLAGMSTGGALGAALEVAADLEEATIVFIACDRGDRYLSGDLFA